MNVISILLLIFIPTLLKNKKTFPLVFILLNTNILEFSYGSTSWVLFSFGGGATANIFLSYYVSIILILFSIQYLNKNPEYIIVFKPVFIVIVLLLILGLLIGFYYGIQIKTLARVVRSFIRYTDYLYLAIYLFISRENTLRFIRTMFFLLLVSFGIQIFEIVSQQRVIIDFLAPAKNEWASYFFEDIYIIIPGFGEIFYAWSRFHYFAPLAILISLYFYFSRINIFVGINNILFVFISLLSIFLSFSRVSMLLVLITILLLYVFTLLTEKRVTGRGIVVILSSVAIIFSLIIQFQEFFSAIVGRLSSVEDLRYGEDTAISRLVVLQHQLKNFYDSVIFGKGFSFEDSFFIISADLGITNLLPVFGLLGLVLPFTILIICFSAIKKIKVYDKQFFIVTAVTIIVFIILFGLFQDVYLDKISMIYSIFAVIEAKINNPHWPNDRMSTRTAL